MVVVSDWGGVRLSSARTLFTKIGILWTIDTGVCYSAFVVVIRVVFVEAVLALGLQNY